MTRKEIKLAAKESLKGNWGVAILALLIAGIILSAVSFSGIGTLILMGPFALGVVMVYSGIVRKQQVGVGTVFGGFSNFANSFLAGLLVSVFTFLWSLLFWIPGIIKSYSYSMTFFILNDHPELTNADAITESRKMMNGHKMELFILDLSFIGWYLLVGLTFGLLSFYVVPYHNAAKAMFYENLKGAAAPAEA
ncbi:MAG: DUF975 family protein [Clostridia bacterium]|nr:DUF975 family protein [Clostridia bacterium]